jgi:hypothetical protein
MKGQNLRGSFLIVPARTNCVAVRDPPYSSPTLIFRAAISLDVFSPDRRTGEFHHHPDRRTDSWGNWWNTLEHFRGNHAKSRRITRA